MLVWFLAVQLAAPPVEPSAEAKAPTRAQLLEAAEELAEQYARTEDPAYKFGQGVALARAGECDEARAAFEAFEETEPPAADVAAANDELSRCEQVRPRARTTPPPDRVAPPEVEPAVAPPTERSEPEVPRRVDRVGWALFGSGAGLAVAGAALYGSSFAVAAAGGSETQSDYLQREQRVRGLSIAGAVVGTVAVGLLAAGIARWVVVARRRPNLSVTHHGLMMRF